MHFLLDRNTNLAQNRKDKQVRLKSWMEAMPSSYLQDLSVDHHSERPHSMRSLEGFFLKISFPRSEIACILEIWLCRVVFPGRSGDLLCPKTFYVGCGLALGAPLALCLAMDGIRRAISDITHGFSL